MKQFKLEEVIDDDRLFRSGSDKDLGIDNQPGMTHLWDMRDTDDGPRMTVPGHWTDKMIAEIIPALNIAHALGIQRGRDREKIEQDMKIYRLKAALEALGLR